MLSLKLCLLSVHRSAADPDLAQPPVNGEALLSSLRSAGAAAWSEHLPKPIREALQESTETLA